MSSFALHPEAYNDLDEIWEFIAEASPAAADRVREDIYRTIRLLVATPYLGHRRIDLTSRPLRFFSVRNYLIAYAPRDKPLWVVAVIHGARSSRVMAAILRSREERLQ